MTYANQLELHMLELINQERTNLGLNLFKLETNLNSSAEDHSEWMLAANVFSHTGSADSSATQRIVAAGFDLSGSWGTAENIAIQSSRGEAGYFDDVQDLHTSLMNSPGHRANLLNPNLEFIGIGIEVGPFTYDSGFRASSVIVTQNFGRTAGSVDLDDLNGGATLPFIGTESANTINGTAADNRIEGNGGNDKLYGQGGNDVLIGGADDDVLLGGAGADSLNGGSGFDRAQYTDATAGVIVDLQVASANTGIAAGDTFVSIERLYGSSYDDNLRGDGAANILWGHYGNDSLFGRGGNDNLSGMDGNDKLYGQSGNDVLTGGADNDTFIFESEFGQDTITDFDVSQFGERISLRDVAAITDFSDLIDNHLTQSGGNSIIDDGAGNTITLIGVSVGVLDVEDFIF